MSIKKPPVVYHFSTFTFCPDEFQLVSEKDKYQLSPREAQVLEMLVKNAGLLVDKDWLMAEIWGANPVEEVNISKLVYSLRGKLGGEKEEFIETCPRRGYKFLKDVRVRRGRGGQGATWGTDVDWGEKDPEGARKEEELDMPGLKVVSVYNFWKRGYTTEQLVQSTMAIDYESIHELDEEAEGSKEQWIRVVNHSPDNISLLLHEGDEDDKARIAGYWHFQPIGEDVIEELEKGTFEDSLLMPDKVRLIVGPGEYDLYFVIFIVRLQFRGFKANRLLYDALVRRFEEMEKAGVRVRKVWANPFTQEGVALCKTFGLKKVQEHVRKGAIYAGEMPSLVGKK